MKRSSIAIDRKFEFMAVNPCNGHFYTHRSGIVFAAKDEAVPAMLDAYMKKCEGLGCSNEHIHSMALAKGRIMYYQRVVEHHVPDTHLECEIARCINGENLDR